MRIQFTHLILVLAAGLTRASEPMLPAQLSLEDALRLAQENQPQVREAQALSEAAQARADQAGSGLWLQVTGNAGFQRTTANFSARPGSFPGSPGQTSSSNSLATFNYFNAGLSANQLLYDFGQTTGRWDAAQASATAQRQSERTARLQLAYQVRTAFFQARASKALVKVAEDSLTNQERHLAQVQGFVELGSRPEIDLAQVRSDLANIRVQLISAQNSLATAKARLNQAMGIPASGGYDISDDVLPDLPGEDDPLDSLLEEALRARPEFAVFQNQLRAQELGLQSTKGSTWPSLSLSTGFTSAGTQLDGMGWNWSGGLNLSWPLFQGGLTRAQIAEDQANLAHVKHQVEGVRQQVRLEVEQARLAVRAAKATIGAADDAAVNAKKRLELAEGRYQTGVGNMIELGDAQLALSSAEAQKVQADFSLAAARAQMLAALGRP